MLMANCCCYCYCNRLNLADELIDAYELRQYREAVLRVNGATPQEAAAGAAAAAAAAAAAPAAAVVPAVDANGQQQQQQQQEPAAVAGSGSFIGANTFDEYVSESVPLLQEQQQQEQQPVVAAAAPPTTAAAVAAQLKQQQQRLCAAVSAFWSSKHGRVTRLVLVNAAVLFVLSTLALHVPLRLGRALFTAAGTLYIQTLHHFKLLTVLRQRDAHGSGVGCSETNVYRVQLVRKA
jgi:hypothetical protein